MNCFCFHPADGNKAIMMSYSDVSGTRKSVTDCHVRTDYRPMCGSTQTQNHFIYLVNNSHYLTFAYQAYHLHMKHIICISSISFAYQTYDFHIKLYALYNWIDYMIWSNV